MIFTTGQQCARLWGIPHKSWEFPTLVTWPLESSDTKVHQPRSLRSRCRQLGLQAVSSCLSRSSICTGARLNPAACGMHQENRKCRFAAPLRAGGRGGGLRRRWARAPGCCERRGNNLKGSYDFRTENDSSKGLDRVLFVLWVASWLTTSHTCGGLVPCRPVTEAS
jgi:hypothetical protein